MAGEIWVCPECNTFGVEGGCGECGTEMVSLGRAVLDQLELFDDNGKDLEANVMRSLRDRYDDAVDARQKAVRKLQSARADEEAAKETLLDFWNLTVGGEPLALASDEAGVDAVLEAEEPEIIDNLATLDTEAEVAESLEVAGDDITAEGDYASDSVPFEVEPDEAAEVVEAHGDEPEALAVADDAAQPIIYPTEIEMLVAKIKAGSTEAIPRGDDTGRLACVLKDGSLIVEFDKRTKVTPARALATVEAIVTALGWGGVAYDLPTSDGVASNIIFTIPVPVE